MTSLTRSTAAIRILLSDMFCDKDIPQELVLRELESLRHDIGYYMELIRSRAPPQAGA